MRNYWIILKKKKFLYMFKKIKNIAPKAKVTKFDKGGFGVQFTNIKHFRIFKKIIKNYGYKVVNSLKQKSQGKSYYKMYCGKRKNYNYLIIFVVIYIFLYILKRTFKLSFF